MDKSRRRRYSPLPSYIFISSSIAFGVLVLLTYFMDADDAQFQYTVIGALPMGALLVLAGITSLYGLIKYKMGIIGGGAVVSFAMWVFSAIFFAFTNQVATVAIVAVPHLVFFAYSYVVAVPYAIRYVKEKRNETR